MSSRCSSGVSWWCRSREIRYSHFRRPDTPACGRPKCLRPEPQRCQVPERSTLPSAKDIIRSYPIRGSSADLLGFSLDIKSAHKRIVIKDSEWGLVGFTLDDRIYFYRVCPFGATFSAAWWSRVGAFILRCFHRLIWLIHVALLYVDDFFYLSR